MVLLDNTKIFLSKVNFPGNINLVCNKLLPLNNFTKLMISKIDNQGSHRSTMKDILTSKSQTHSVI